AAGRRSAPVDCSFVGPPPPGPAVAEPCPKGPAMSLAYDRTGHGESLVLIHGLGHRRQGWDAVVPLLATDRDVIAVELPAMGESPPPAVGDYRVMADMVEKLFGELGLER